MASIGTSTKALKEVKLNGINCPSCGTQNSLSLHLGSKRFFLSLFPMFPVGKTMASSCNHCKQVLQEKEMPESIRSAGNKLKADVKHPMLSYIGSILLIGVIALIAYSDNQNSKEDAAFLASPKVGDTYEMKMDGDYTTIKIKEIKNDSIYFFDNQYSVNKIKGISKIDKEENYYFIGRSHTKEELATMYEAGEFFDINR